jgi:hypothetical protein
MQTTGPRHCAGLHDIFFVRDRHLKKKVGALSMTNDSTVRKYREGTEMKNPNDEK